MLLMLGATAVLLPLLFPPFYCFFLGPIALVPFCICVLRRPLRVLNLFFYYLLGAAFFLPNLFWIGPVTIGGFIALALFVALYFPLFAFALHRLVIQMRVPATIAVPVVWTAVEYIRSTCVLEGFPWFMLGNTLAPWPVLIQAADIFGVWGLTFFIALLNGFFVDVLRLPLWQVTGGGGGGGAGGGKSRFSPVIGTLTAVAAVTTAFVVAYGVFRLSQQTTRVGPRIAVIQENIPQQLKDDPTTRDEMFIKHLVLTDLALGATPKPDLVAWPETMVSAFINEELLRGEPDTFTTIDELRAALKKASDKGDDYLRIDDIYKSLVNRADRSGVPLLLGYAAFIPKAGNAPMIIQNRTMLLPPKSMERLSRGTIQEYSKVHLVPFGEYIPFRSVPLLKDLMLKLSPVDFDYSNTPGTQWTRFKLEVAPVATQSAAPHPPETYTFATPICFEDVMPEPARRMSAPQYGQGRKTDFLINVSNDGWFHWVELDQHLQACQLRAVENRISIARAVNTGNSGFIDSNGRVVELVGKEGSIGAVGWLTRNVLIDSRVTFFSKIGDLFPIMCGIVTTLLVGWTFVRPRRA